MGDEHGINALIEKGDYRKAADLLDRLLMQKGDDDYFWYLRGIVALRAKAYEYAHECFLRAISISPKSVYYKMNGLAHLEQFELDEANEYLIKAQDGRDAAPYVFLALSYVLSDTEGAPELLKKASSIDYQKTMRLLSYFYNTFFRNNPFVHQDSKLEIERRLGIASSR